MFAVVFSAQNNRSSVLPYGSKTLTKLNTYWQYVTMWMFTYEIVFLLSNWVVAVDLCSQLLREHLWWRTMHAIRLTIHADTLCVCFFFFHSRIRTQISMETVEKQHFTIASNAEIMQIILYRARENGNLILLGSWWWRYAKCSWNWVFAHRIKSEEKKMAMQCMWAWWTGHRLMNRKRSKLENI